MRYLVELGFAPEIARQELAFILQSEKLKYKKLELPQHCIEISTNKPIDTITLMSRLGGVIRIATHISDTDEDHLSNHLLSILRKHSRPTFTLTTLSPLPITPPELKRLLLPTASRFLESDSTFISPLVFHSKKPIEIISIKQDGRWSLYQTTAATNPLDWQFRDRQRPISDPDRGMLPLKVARMLINLAHPQKITNQTTIFDPFCGTGSILMEALVQGANVIGSDIDPTAADATTQNLNWLGQQLSSSQTIKVFTQAAENLSLADVSKPVDAIVAEGDLGANDSSAITNQDIDSLYNLYNQVLPHLYHFLKKTGRLCFALPNHGSYSAKNIQNLIDTCQSAGYTLLAGPTDYSWPKARVKRAIILLQK